MRYILIILFFLVNCIPSEAQWSKITSFTGSSVRDIEYNGGVFYAGASNGAWKSTNAGLTWEFLSNGLSGDALVTWDIFFDSSDLWIATVEGNYKTTNGGTNWDAKSSGIQIGPGATKRFCYTFLRNGGTLFSGAFSGLYKSTDNGDSWTLSGIPGPHSFVDAMYIYNGVIWAGRTNTASNGSLQRSTDNGGVWTPVQFFGQFNPEVFCFHETPDNKLFIGTGHGVYFTSNNGANWTQRNNGLSSDPYNTSITQRGNTMFTTTTFGGNDVLRSSNEGIMWESIGDSLPFLTDIHKLLIAGDTLYLSSSNGIYKRPLSEILTGVSPVSSEIPDKFTLHQNFPNPFNPSTTIRFDMPVSGFVTLNIYDISGRGITSLINENLNPGSYSYNFTSDGLTSGIYFYKLSTGEYTEVKKMLLIK